MPDSDECKLKQSEDGIDVVNLEWSRSRRWVSVKFDGHHTVSQ